MFRVMKPEGQVVILEFSNPEKFPVKQVYRLYFKYILPKIGEWVSKDKSAYSYLPASVEKFPKPDDFLQILSNKGLKNGAKKSLSMGIATMYWGNKAGIL